MEKNESAREFCPLVLAFNQVTTKAETQRSNFDWWKKVDPLSEHKRVHSFEVRMR